MKALLYTLLATFFITRSTIGQTIRLVGTLDGPNKFFSIQSDGTDFIDQADLPSSSFLESGLLEGSDRLMYGTSTYGGVNGAGFIFRMFADGANYETLYTFDGVTDSQLPNGDLIEGSDGMLYGTSLGDGQADGTALAGAVFRMNKDGSNFSILRYFDQNLGDGGWLNSGLMEASDGMLYGVTETYGANSRGTIFRMSKDGSNFSVVYNFGTSGGCCWSSRLVEDNGVLYGINGSGGGFSVGAIYSYTISTGTYSGLGGIPVAVGSTPDENIILDNGYIYGFTSGGGANGEGTVFKFELATGTYTIIHSFTAAQSGDKSLILGSNGKLYGVIQLGGTNGAGSLFELTTNGTFSEYHSFTSPNGQPKGELLEFVNIPPTVANPVTDINIPEGTSIYALDVSSIFDDPDGANLVVAVLDVSNYDVFNSVNLVNDVLTFNVVDDTHGTSTITMIAEDSWGDDTQTNFDFTVSAVADDPIVTSTTTEYKTLNTDGLVVSRNPVDGNEVTHFKVSNITDGVLFRNDGITAIEEGDFVTFDEGALGLKFIPSKAGSSSFDIQASLSGSDADVGGSIVTAIITASQVPLTITADAKSKVYGASNPDFSFSYIGFLDDDDESVLDVLPMGTTVVEPTTDVGVYDIQVSGASDNNYFISYTNATFTIEQADLTVIANDEVFRYGDTVFPEFSLSYEGFVNNEDESVIDTEPSGFSTSATLASPRGVYTIKTNQDGIDNNYNLVYEDGELTIGKAVLTVVANDLTKVYGEENPVLSLTYSGFVNEEDVSVLNEQPSITTVALQSSNTGTYDITPSGGSGDNYDFQYVSGALSITRATLMANADDQTINQGEPLPDLTITYTGFVNSETIEVIDQIPIVTPEVNSSSESGEYDLVLSGGSDDNYELTLINGKLTIEEVLSAKRNNDQVVIFPNPTQNILYTTNIKQAVIYGVSGDRRMKISGSQVDISKLSSGTYILKGIDSNNDTFEQRLLIR